MADRLGIIAGTGRLPELLLDAYPEAVLGRINGFAPSVHAAREFDCAFERLGRLIADLRAHQVTRICFAGGAARPKLRLARLDVQTWLWLPRVLAAIRAGDSGAFGIVRKLFESKGFQIIGAHDLRPDLVVERPMLLAGEYREFDIDAARRAHHLMGLADSGQALVLRGSQVLATEARAGTAAMLAELGNAKGGFLYKSSKLGQDLDFDMATIGPETVDQAAAAGLGGIVIEAGRVIVLDREAVIARAQSAGITVMAVAALAAG